MDPLNICLVSSEATPFAKSGGLADVTSALAIALGELGHDARLVLPAYGRIRAAGRPLTPVEGLQDVETRIGERTFTWSVSTAPLAEAMPAESARAAASSKGAANTPSTAANATGARAWFIRCPELFGGDELYRGDERDALRFLLLSRAAIELCQHLQWRPDVFHCNDWHTALIPFLLQTRYSWDALFEKARTLLTIHNLGYQGTFAPELLGQLGLEQEKHLFHQEELRDGRFSFMVTGILYADALSAVSQTYAREIQTAEHGMGLDGMLRQRSADLFGIVNGVGPEWDPSTDTRIQARFGPGDLAGKTACRKALLAKLELEDDPRVPVVGVVSRLTRQKGFELLPDVLPIFLQRGYMRLVVLGSGEQKYEEYFRWLQGAFAGRVAFRSGYDEGLAHSIEAASDMFLMPSRYEPCGLNQMYSQLYGAVPIVRRTGGLADTVEEYDAARDTGTGFLFDEFRAEALQDAVERALRVWVDRDAWRRLVDRGMRRDFSWKTRAQEYETLYRRLIDRA